MVHRKALAMDNLNSSSIILPRASSHLQHQPHSQHRRNNSLRMRRLFKNVLCQGPGYGQPEQQQHYPAQGQQSPPAP